MEPRRRGRSGLNAAHGRWAVWLIGPTLLLLAIVIGYPVVSAIVQSFQNDAGLDKATGMFVSGGFAGVANYVHWLGQRCGTGGSAVACPPGSLGATFWTSFGNTFFFTAVTVVFETVIGVWMAIIMNRPFTGRALVRAAVLVPWAIPTAVTAKLWYFIFDVNGVLNQVLGTHVLWTSGEWSSRFAIVIADTWKTTPFMALLILAGLQLIPEEVYEAGKVDGATTVQRFLHITLPLVRPALMVAVLFRVLDALRLYDLPAILTGGGGGSGNATTTLSILVVEQIRQGFNSASALSTITFLVIFAVAFLFVRFLGANVVQTQAAQQKGELR
ncbi:MULTISPECIES: carbohydrate ABC transporter permease [unclassified Curtobacterium]|uniref:carbohydrate ABC transporter permease n=1 Tax=unclassified Curtobacterium TaxID=257496 RepID=UPI000DA97D90|nr:MULTISPECIES: sugar ABC transporter permease [unclassified Curtobacterium]PZE28988.1 sugar ABC transporter permease [Curtobacterium sp. MCBD17_028]PZF57503.1 sugar ABC transporter permease [Curtobacterium sp. MCBD17_034]PZM33594.1 sugar ABC transporter permease [Curtobacterium sp. MCBD17_031]WIB65164.1 sugar ABC transporter permease [Curtobacterium sp. MCBD17_040]WIB69040.1 sugar ABC transporter permease [Curtobacterium sp. MCBD17_035]